MFVGCPVVLADKCGTCHPLFCDNSDFILYLIFSSSAGVRLSRWLSAIRAAPLFRDVVYFMPNILFPSYTEVRLFWRLSVVRAAPLFYENV